MTTRAELATRVERRRATFREAISRLSERAQTTELVRLLLFPGAFTLVVGFVFMFFGWYGAARTPREIEQIPYLISGGFIGLGLVFVGGLLLASAMWMSMLQRFAREAEERAERRIAQTEERRSSNGSRGRARSRRR